LSNEGSKTYAPLYPSTPTDLVPDLAPSLFRGFPEKSDEKSEKVHLMKYELRINLPNLSATLRGNTLEELSAAAQKIEALTANPLDLPKIDPSMVEPEWIEWHGGECPVTPEYTVEVRFRDGDVVRDDAPHRWDWNHLDYHGDIVAYRVLSK